jgi:hypothetical protein
VSRDRGGRIPRAQRLSSPGPGHDPPGRPHRSQASNPRNPRGGSHCWSDPESLPPRSSDARRGDGTPSTTPC